ncbi:YdcF family protein [Planktothrix agardhii 1811]|uniref:YdcF family protein n=1 Tax=Planktothrix agardhii TaxID=1160 RepID=UPI001F29A630|nr:YdcF family protein [Planktothrix agardhii]MCF3580049.1 YdcF family protein [Planktothrix agardhii 1811]
MKRSRGPRRWLRWLAVALLPLAVLMAGFLWFLGEAAAEPEAPARRTDAIVVLTGGQERVETALDLLEAGLAPRLLVSGVAPGLTLAELARAHGRAPAALSGRVTLGRAAATTTGNAAETAAWLRAERLGPGSPQPVRTIRVVTAGYHMPRALLELRRALPGVELVAHPVGPAALRRGEMPWLRVGRLLAGEYVKFGLALAGLSALLPAREAARR